jgi:hypothetical protein
MDTIWTKDSSDVLWFQFDWTAFLAAGETITTATVTATSVTVISSNISAGNLKVNANVSGGTTDAAVLCRITTSLGNTFYAHKTIYVRERDV